MIDDEDRPAQWKRGVHTDANGKAHLLRDMSTDYLKATINAFSHVDTKHLEKALYLRILKEAQVALEGATSPKARAAYRALTDYLDDL